MKNLWDRATRLQKTMASNCFVLIFLCPGFGLSAQTLSLSGGVSIPSGLYASDDFTQKDCGLAKTGYTLNALFEDNRKGRLINPFIQFTHNTNPLDEEAVEKYVMRVVDPKVIGLQAYKPWTQNLLMAGIKANYYNSHYSLYGKAGAGLAWLSTFGYTYYDTSQGFDIIKRKVATENALVLNIGIGGNIQFYENVSLNFGYDFFFSKASFGKPSYVDAAGKPIGSSEVYAAPFQTSTVYLGLSFHMRRLYEKNKKNE